MFQHFIKYNLSFHHERGSGILKDIYGAYEDSQDAFDIFRYLSKAFDCVHHTILIRKLQHYDKRLML